VSNRGDAARAGHLAARELLPRLRAGRPLAMLRRLDLAEQSLRPDFRAGRFPLTRFKLGAALALAVIAALAIHAPKASASADVHKLSLVISGVPGSLAGTGFNNQVGQFNAVHLTSHGLEGVGSIQFAWSFGADLHYFVRQNVAVDMGIAQTRSGQKREYLPGLTQDVQIRTEVLSVPVHLGADYYFAPYNQGDFQARGYLGGGVMSALGNKLVMEQVEVNTDSTSTLGGSGIWRASHDAPGYYVEGGVHMFFASKFSVMLGAIYRSIVVREMQGVNGTLPSSGPNPTKLLGEKPFDLDLSGVGAKLAIGIGF
jgi:hypothetical protein